MLESLSRDWWTLVLRGVVAVALGLLAFAFPGLTVAALTLLFGIYAMADGVLALVAAVRLARQHRGWWMALLEGIFGIAAGVVAFTYTMLTALILLYIMATWAILTGILEIVLAIELRKVIGNEWLMGFSGVVSIIFGVFLCTFPGAGLVAWAWMFGIYAVIFGAAMIALGVRLHRHAGHSGTSGYLAQH